MLRTLAAQGTSYTTPDIDPNSLSYSSDDWDGDDAVASYPNDVDDYSADFLLVPQSDDDRGDKSAYKLPFRNSHEGNANTNALDAIVAAINGARGGVEGVDRDTLEDAFDMAVAMNIAAGEYDGPDDAPEFSPANAAVAEAQDFEYSTGDMVKGGSRGGTWYGRIMQRTADGTFDDEITTGSGDDADQSVSGTEDNPAYLIQIYQERGADDSDQTEWVPGDAVVAHRESAVDDWDIDSDRVQDMEGAAVGTRVQAAVSVSGSDSTDGLTGVVWGAGTHSLHVNGQPTEVYVPEDTVKDTYDRLQSDIEAGDPPGIGVDHFDGLAADDVPVAADTGLLEIGEATGFDLSADERQIVMTDSDLTNPQAQQVAASGGFDGLDYSIVGDILLATDANGQPQTTDDGSLQVDAVRIHRVDVVDDGAVESASVGNVPELAASIAARRPAAGAQYLTTTLRAAATAHDDTPNMGNFDPSSFNDLSAAVEAAADVIDEKDDTINELEAQLDDYKQKANAFDQIAAASGLDPTDDDVSAQDVVDAQTEDLRREIADMEASLPAYDVDSVEARADDLKGNSPDELQAIRGDRATEILRTGAEYDARNTAVPAQSGRTQASGAGGGGTQNDDADEIAEGVMNGKDVIQARSTDQSPAEFVQAKYGVDPADHDSEDSLRQAINAADGGAE